MQCSRRNVNISRLFHLGREGGIGRFDSYSILESASYPFPALSETLENSSGTINEKCGVLDKCWLLST